MKDLEELGSEHPAHAIAAERPPIKSRLLRFVVENIVSPFINIFLIISFTYDWDKLKSLTILCRKRGGVEEYRMK
jgi:hypothetical protein